MRRRRAAGTGINPAAQWAGRILSCAGFVAWSVWLGWRIASSTGAIGVVVLVLEVAALLVAVVLSTALWSVPDRMRPPERSSSLVDVVGALVGLDEMASLQAHGMDDTGEVARARRGLELLDPRASSPVVDRRLAVTAWAFVAVEGIRRLLFVVVLVIVLLSGRFPFEIAHWTMFATLVVAQVFFALGHWMLSGGVLWPGIRLRWSMASVGAGLGDGTSRTGLPIRWTSTLSTMVVLNLAVSLRGVSDRWTHGLGPMPHDERVIAMVLAAWLVLVGFASLRILLKPSLGYYGATRRLEEPSTRRLAIGATMVVALFGFVAGVLPGGLPA
jgi:hypothetical protein